MPELPEVEVVKRSLKAKFKTLVVKKISNQRKQITLQNKIE